MVSQLSFGWLGNLNIDGFRADSINVLVGPLVLTRERVPRLPGFIRLLSEWVGMPFAPRTVCMRSSLHRVIFKKNDGETLL